MHISLGFWAENPPAAENHCRTISRAASWHEDADFGGCWRHENLIWLPRSVEMEWKCPSCCPHLSPHAQTPKHRLGKCGIHNPGNSCLLWRGNPTLLPQRRWGSCGIMWNPLSHKRSLWRKTLLEKSRGRTLSLLGKWSATRRQDNRHQAIV